VVSPQLEVQCRFIKQHDVVKTARIAAQRLVFNMPEN